MTESRLLFIPKLPPSASQKERELQQSEARAHARVNSIRRQKLLGSLRKGQKGRISPGNDAAKPCKRDETEVFASWACAKDSGLSKISPSGDPTPIKICMQYFAKSAVDNFTDQRDQSGKLPYRTLTRGSRTIVSTTGSPLNTISTL